MLDRGAAPLENPTVKVWLPPGVRQVGLAGDLLMRHGATLTGIPDEGACLVALPSLARNSDRVLFVEDGLPPGGHHRPDDLEAIETGGRCRE